MVQRFLEMYFFLKSGPTYSIGEVNIHIHIGEGRNSLVLHIGEGRNSLVPKTMCVVAQRVLDFVFGPMQSSAAADKGCLYNEGCLRGLYSARERSMRVVASQMRQSNEPLASWLFNGGLCIDVHIRREAVMTCIIQAVTCNSISE